MVTQPPLRISPLTYEQRYSFQEAFPSTGPQRYNYLGSADIHSNSLLVSSVVRPKITQKHRHRRRRRGNLKAVSRREAVKDTG